MEENTELTYNQLVFFTFIGIIGNIVYIHTWIDNAADRAAWVASFAGMVLLTPFALWILFLGKHSPQASIFDILEAGLGKILSWPLGLIFVLINTAVAATQLKMFTEMLKVFFLLFTPQWVIMLVLVIMGVILAHGGIVSFGRLVVMLTVIGLLDYFFTFIPAFPNFVHTEYVFPIFNTTLAGFAKGAIFITESSAEFLLLLMIIVRYFPQPAKLYSGVVIGIVLSGAVFSYAILVIIAVMGPELSKRIAFGGVNAARLIQIGEFVQGLEVLILGTYQFIAIGKLTMCLFCSWSVTKTMFRNKLPFLQLLIIAVLIMIPAVWINSYNLAYFLGVDLARYIILPFSIVVLLLASLSTIILNNKAGSTGK